MIPLRADLGSRLRTIESADPKVIRARLLDALAPEPGADFVMSFDLATTPVGYQFVQVTASAPPDLAFWAGATEGKPWPDARVWDPRRPERRQLGRFLGIHHHRLLQTPESKRVWSDNYHPIGITDQARALLYHRGEFIGFVGIMSRGDHFTPKHLRDLGQVHDALVAAFLTARRADRGLLEPADIVLHADGTIEHASGPTSAWLDEDRRAWLCRCVLELDRGAEPTGLVAHGVRARFVRLYGASGARYLAHLEALAPVTVAATAGLTPRQREVAGYAAVGATRHEIGKTLGMSELTVHAHLKAIYERLQVASRVELAEALRLADDERLG